MSDEQTPDTGANTAPAAPTKPRRRRRWLWWLVAIVLGLPILVALCAPPTRAQPRGITDPFEIDRAVVAFTGAAVGAPEMKYRDGRHSPR